MEVRPAGAARPRWQHHVRRLVLMQGMKPALAGIAAELIGAAFGTKLLSGMLFGIGAGGRPKGRDELFERRS